MDWYYIKDGQQVGPVDEQNLFDLARQGAIAPTDRVWNASMGGEWGFASAVPGLFPAEAPAWHQAPDRGAGRPSDGGVTSNASLTEQARAALQGRWWLGAGAALLVTLLPLPLSFIPIIGTLAAYAVTPQLQLGWAGFALRIARRDGQLDVGRVFDGFHNYWKALGLFLLSNLFILLWTLLLIIPGIMAAYSYAMAFFILNDHPEIGVNEAIGRSKAMMHGHRWKLFCLSCRFIGWALLSILTCGIGWFFLMPYMQVSFAHFYEDIR
jgi:uncharacterized membrane protein